MEQQLESVANILTSLDNLDHLIQSSRPTDSSPSTTPQEIQSAMYVTP